MKSPILRVTIILLFLLALVVPAATAVGQDPVSELGQGTDRPLVVIKSYYLNVDTIRPNDRFSLYLDVHNDGALDAHNLIFAFTSDDFLPMETGGVIAVGSMGGNGTKKTIVQPMLASTNLWGKTSGSISVQLSYNGPSGEAFSESFTITLQVLGWSGAAATQTPTPTVTPTSTAAPRAQLVVGSYGTTVAKLQPGSIFNLSLVIHNLGGGEARSVTMILGGGTFGTSPGEEGTPVPGGVSGGSADLSVFAPMGSSNLQYLGDILPGKTLAVEHDLIVNVSANPGAYTLKISFVYTDAKGNRQVDDQIITMLVYSLPQIEASLYRDPGPIMAMMPNTIPLQVVNLGRKTAVLGNMTISAEGADLMNNTSLIGTLEPGGYFPLDVMLIPQAAGPVELKITILYTDDFNQPNVIELVIPIEVQESMGWEDPGGMAGPGMDPQGEGFYEEPQAQETFWQKVVRFFRGLFGLDSAPPSNDSQFPGEMEPDMQPMPAGPGGKG